MKKLIPILLLCLLTIGCAAQQPQPGLEVQTINFPDESFLKVKNKLLVPVNKSEIVGQTGPVGATGPQGAQGTPGANGTNGIQGPIGPTGPQGPAGPAGNADLPDPATGSDNNVLGVAGGKWVFIEATLIQGFGHIDSAFTSLSLPPITTTVTQYSAAISATINSFNGELLIKCEFIDSSGNRQIFNFPPVTKVGAYSPGIVNIDVKKGTQARIYTEVTGDVNYNFSWNFHQL